MMIKPSDIYFGLILLFIQPLLSKDNHSFPDPGSLVVFYLFIFFSMGAVHALLDHLLLLFF